MEPPQTRYTRSGDVSIAYQVVGDGPLDLVWIPSLAHHVELNWENPVVAGGTRIKGRTSHTSTSRFIRR